MSDWFAQIISHLSDVMLRYLLPRRLRVNCFNKEWLTFLAAHIDLLAPGDRQGIRYVRTCHDWMVRRWRVERVVPTGPWVGEFWSREN